MKAPEPSLSNAWEITLAVECTDPEHMNVLVQLTRQYLEAAMTRTTRHDAKLTGMWLTRKEEPHANNNPAA